jgi:hypothetical protein
MPDCPNPLLENPKFHMRFDNVQELLAFVAYYGLTFPCRVRVWQGRQCTVWMVASEPSSIAPAVDSAAPPVTTGAAMPTCVLASAGNVTRPAE